LNVHGGGSLEPLGAQQRRDHVDGDDGRADAPEYGDQHRHTRFRKTARAAKARKAPPPIARKIRSDIADASD
jgi:hypothetical protein